MKTNKAIRGLINVLMVMALLAGSAMAADLAKKKVLVISGVNKQSAERVGYNLVYNGINQGLRTVGITPVYQWADINSLMDDAVKTAAADEAIALAKAENPDLIITLNDDALKFIGARIDQIPVVFAWVFGEPKALGMPKENVTGVTRTSYAADIWSLAHKLMGVKNVALISKNNTSMEGIKKILTARADMLEQASGVRFKDMILCDDFEDWEKAVTTFPYDIIYLADTSRIVRDGKEMTRAETTAWTVEHSKVPVIGSADGDVAAGALYAIVTSETGIGLKAAELAIETLSSGKVSQDYQPSKKGKLVFNLKTAQKYNLEIPYDILSSAETIYE